MCKFAPFVKHVLRVLHALISTQQAVAKQLPPFDQLHPNASATQLQIPADETAPLLSAAHPQEGEWKGHQQ